MFGGETVSRRGHFDTHDGSGRRRDRDRDRGVIEKVGAGIGGAGSVKGVGASPEVSKSE